MEIKPRMVELVDTRDLKSLGALLCAGSSPASGTFCYPTKISLDFCLSRC